MNPLITVVVPAYNAEATLPETLDSIARQTYPNFETIVVDDGSRDRTRCIAEAFAAQRPGTRVITTANGGVAAARNTGIEAAAGIYVAPVDADDLWHPEKLARQVAILADDRVTLVYANRRHIDARGYVLNSMPPATLEGFAYMRHAAFNVVGNGSAIMFRRSDAMRLGGYDPGLRAQGGQGCEDYLIQVRLARIGAMRVAPGFLVGYRQLDDAMSRDNLQMLRSRMLALEVLAEEENTFPHVLRSIQALFAFRLGAALMAKGRLREGATMMAIGMRGVSPSMALELVDRVTHRSRRKVGYGRMAAAGGRKAVKRHFYDYQVDEDADSRYPPMVERLMRRYLPYDLQLEAANNGRTASPPEDAARQSD